MICPKCGGGHRCGCKSCIKRFGDHPDRGINDYENELISCAHCGHTETLDWWFDESCKQFLAEKYEDVLYE